MRICTQSLIGSGKMKKIILFIFLFVGYTAAQVYDLPYDSTAHYKLRLYNQSARSSATVLNNDKKTIDSVMYSLIVYTDTLQFTMVSDTSISATQLVFKISDYATGMRSFVTTSQIDSVTFSQTLDDSLDVFLLTPYGATVSPNDVLGYTVSGTKLYVHRPASGTSGLKYVWRRIKRNAKF